MSKYRNLQESINDADLDMHFCISFQGLYCFSPGTFFSDTFVSDAVPKATYHFRHLEARAAEVPPAWPT